MNNVAAAKGVTIEYHWNDGNGRSGTWRTDPKKAQRAINRRNARANQSACSAGKCGRGC